MIQIANIFDGLFYIFMINYHEKGEANPSPQSRHIMQVTSLQAHLEQLANKDFGIMDFVLQKHGLLQKAKTV